MNSEQGTGDSGEQKDEDRKSLNPLQVVGSVLAAAFGVQSSRNRERDFKQGSFGTFIAAGIIFTLLFIGTLYLVVSAVLSNAR